MEIFRRSLNYGKSATLFVCRNFPYLILFAILPAVCHGWMRTEETYFDFFDKLRSSASGKLTFQEIYVNFSMIFSNRSLIGLLALILYAVGISGMAYQVEKIMRIGKRNFSGMAHGFNNNILTTVIAGALYILSYELISLLLSAFLIAFSAIFSTGFVYFISIVFILAAYVAYTYVATPFFVWIPCLFVNGYRFTEGFVEATYLLENKWTSVAISVVTPFLISQLVFLLLKVAFNQVFFAVKIIVYAFTFLYYVALAYTVFFDLTGLERVDLKKKYGGK